MKKILQFISALVLIPTALSACSKQEVDTVYTPVTTIGKTLLENNAGYVARVYRDTSFVLADGVTQTELHVQMMDGYIEQIYIIKANTKIPGVSLKVAMPFNSNEIADGWRKQTLTEMAGYLSKPHSRVVGMVNGDFWDVANPIKPRGPVHRGGIIVSDVWNYSDRVPQQALSFVAVNDEGQMVIGDRKDYPSVKSSLVECTGAGFMFLAKGQIIETAWTALDPRTAIGHTDDGTVYLLTADGRKTFGGAGLSYKHLAHIFKALGCTYGANLDGGGSAQILIRHPVANVYQIRNSPADGTERPVINSWAVTVNEY